VCPLDVGVEERGGDGLLGRELGPVLPDAHSDSEDRVAGLQHRRPDVGEVEVDQSGEHHEV
jgi:hypothetical protein